MHSPSLIERHFLSVIASKKIKAALHGEERQGFHRFPLDWQLLPGWSCLRYHRCHAKCQAFDSLLMTLV